MADGIFLKSGGGVTSEDVNIGRYQALKGTRLLTSDSDDEVVSGTMPDNSTRTSNGSVPGISSAVSGIPTRRGENMHITVNTDGESVLNIAPTQGYYPGNGASFINRPASELGNAGTDQVLIGASFTSKNGLNLQGTIYTWNPMFSGWSDVVYAAGDEVKVGDDIRGTRGIYVKLLNGFYIQGANWAFAAIPTLRSENIRAGVNIAGMVGSLVDTSTGRVAFNGATFDGVLLSGVADKTVTTTTGENTTFYSGSNTNLRRYTWDGSAGMRFDVAVSNRTSSDSYYAGAFFGTSIDLYPFRKIKIGYKVQASGKSDSAAFTCGIGLKLFLLDKNQTTIQASQNRYHGLMPYVDILRESFIPEIGFTELEHSKNGVQYFKELDISGYAGQHFIGFGASGSTDTTTSTGYATIWVNYIEFMN